MKVSFQQDQLTVQEPGVDDEDVEDIGYVDVNNKFVPNPNLKKYNPRITTMGASKRGSLVLPKPEQKKKVSYDDILNSLNMKVVDGKLQLSRNHHSENVNHKTNLITNPAMNTQTLHTASINNQSNKNKQIQNMFQMRQQTDNTHKTHTEPTSSTRPPLSKEQYKRLQQVHYIKMIQEQQRVNEIKSKKILFSNSQNQPATPVRSSTSSTHFLKFL
jgi:hypothetical protein